MGSQAWRLHGDVILRQSAATKLIAILLFAVVGAALFLLSLGQYARVEPVRGVLVPARGYAKIYAQHPGTVSRLLVEDGQRVEAGQRLAVVQVESPTASGGRASEQALGSIDNQMRLTNEQISLVTKRADQEEARLSGIVEGLQRQREALAEQIGLQQEIVDTMTANLSQIASVVTKGFISKLEFDRRRQTLLAAREDLSRLRQQQRGVDAEIARTTNERGQVGLGSANDRANMRTSLEGMRQQHNRTEGEREYALIAPLAGRITMVQTGEGRAVQGQTPLMAIIPDNAPLQANLYVPSRAIGFVREGAEVRLMYDAFPFQRFGSHPAHIVSISRLAIAGQETDAPFSIDEPVYKVTARLDAQRMSVAGGAAPLQAGMTLVGNMILERRSFLEWLLEPLRSVSGRS